jgi:DNA-binding transcriptional ArsR family regulator
VPADQLSRAFAALADPTRRDIVARLAVADAAVNELAEPYDISVQAVSKHLRVLEEAGLVTRPGEGARRPAHLDAEVFDLMTRWIERYRRRAEERYQRLDAVLAAMPDDPDHPDHPDDPDHPHEAATAARPSHRSRGGAIPTGGAR